MCDCRKDIEVKLTERFKEAAPDATGHEVALQGYGFAIVDSVMTMKPYMPYTTAADFPMKKGGTKRKKQTGNMVFSFCPFCGEEFDKKEAEPGQVVGGRVHAALSAPGCERLRDFYEVGPVQRAAVESFFDAARGANGCDGGKQG